MKSSVLILTLAAAAVAASAQMASTPAAATAAKPATATSKTAAATTKTATAAKPATAAAKSAAAARTAAGAVKLPPGIPALKGPLQPAFTLRYQEAKIGTGAEAETGKVYAIHYTGWLASDGSKFDSSYDHPPTTVYDKDLKPVMGADGKPQQAPAQPIRFVQGTGRVIPGWDQGFYGMKVGGKRRLFIPWQLAYGVKGHPTGDPKNPGIPPKADLIFDVELVAINDLPAPQAHQGMGMPSGHPMPMNHPAMPGAPAAAPAAGASAPAAAPVGAPESPAKPAAPVPVPAPAPASAPAPAAPPAK